MTNETVNNTTNNQTLRGANLRGPDLSGVNLGVADLRGVDFRFGFMFGEKESDIPIYIVPPLPNDTVLVMGEHGAVKSNVVNM